MPNPVVARRRGLFTALVACLATACGPPPGAPHERIIIPAGAGVHAIADSLAAHGVISSARWFRILARVGGYDRRLRSGPYELIRGQGARAALRALTSGRALLTRFTVPEGYTLQEMAQAAESTLGIPRDVFLEATRDTALLREYAVPAASFEGFLKPETYLFASGVGALAVVRTMAGAARAEWDTALVSAATAQGLDRMTTMILASLVEGEAKVEQDRPLVAAVYRNRLRIGMPLQADPTVQYAIEQATGRRKSRLYEKDYGVPSPYNTYLKSGLPPGPVGAPGRRSIEAVLAAPTVPFLYFVAGPGGAHIFTRSYAEHLRAVRRVQRAN
ncbi:MAG TPA: endolytic transglycosylase MltG [Gemmatimonadales bacterium]|nr:endolytic transglycosylase MltG [Gemmatimonadales bacterium]